jgi:hypothetical protein
MVSTEQIAGLRVVEVAVMLMLVTVVAIIMVPVADFDSKTGKSQRHKNTDYDNDHQQLNQRETGIFPGFTGFTRIRHENLLENVCMLYIITKNSEMFDIK